MGETANIAEIAARIADDLFGNFLWESRGPRDEGWPCEEPEEHSKHRKKKPASPKATSENDSGDSAEADASVKHPTDVVFFYDEPYSLHRTYINCDLKSYAKTSIKKNEVKKAIESLARSIKCAEKSDVWRGRYVHEGVNAFYVGLLFVYNHDGEYNSSFDDLVSTLKTGNLDIPRNSKVIVVGPKDIFWLDNVSDEIFRMHGKGEIGPKAARRFFYPTLVLAKNVQPSARAATIEMLLGPWIVMKHQLEHKNKESVLVFFRGKGEQMEEFSLLIDYLMFHGLVDDGVDIVVRGFALQAEARVLFDKAIEDYIVRYDGGKEIRDRLKAITYRSMTEMRRSFSTSELGMKRGQ